MPADLGYEWSALTPEQQREAVKRSGRARTPEDMNRFLASAQADPTVGNQLLEGMRPKGPEASPPQDKPGGPIIGDNFDARFQTKDPGAVTHGYPVDDAELMRALMRRRQMMNGGAQPLEGEIAYDLGMMNQR